MNIHTWTTLFIGAIVLSLVYILIEKFKNNKNVKTTIEKIRIAIVLKNKVLLVHNPDHKARMQHPLYTQLQKGERREEGVKRLMNDMLPESQDAPQFLLKYIADEGMGNNPSHIVYLYVLNVQEESLYTDLLPDATFTDCTTIDRYAKESRVTPDFMEEFSYLRNTVILCNQLLSNRRKNKEN